MRYLFCLVMSVIFLATVTLLAGETKANQEWFYNDPQCPIKIDISKYAAEITNLSDKTITQYQLGCVKNDKNNTIISKMMPVVTDLKVKHFLLEGADDAPLPLYDSMKECHKKHGQITVLEVVVDGKDKWQLPSIQK